MSAEFLIPDENTLKCVLCLVLLNLLPMCNSVVFNLGNKDGCLSDAAFSEVFVNQLSALPCQTPLCSYSTSASIILKSSSFSTS